MRVSDLPQQRQSNAEFNVKIHAYTRDQIVQGATYAKKSGSN